jgi:UDP-glucose:(heptosyl)LPS alpha-1,3-glucosyltransferase
MFAILDDLVEQDLLSVGIPAERLRRVDNGIDLQEYYPLTAHGKADLRSKFGLPVDASVLLFCGQLTKRKGVDELLAVWTTGFARANNAVLAICGDGPLRGEVELARASSNGSIVYFGPVADSAEHMRMADALILPSLFESFGNVIIEALASGVPVAATHCGVAPRVLADGRVGWLISDTSQAAIRSILHRIFSDSGRWEAMGAEGRSVARAFSFERVAENYLHMYSELARDSLHQR